MTDLAPACSAPRPHEPADMYHLEPCLSLYLFFYFFPPNTRRSRSIVHTHTRTWPLHQLPFERLTYTEDNTYARLGSLWTLGEVDL